MRKVITMVLVAATFAFVAVPGALANDPHTEENPTGPPSKSCQEVEPNTPGHASESPGSPFNEPEINSEKGGTGGQHYSEKAQYDVACYQHQQHAEEHK
jgi:hypothetical protein